MHKSVLLLSGLLGGCLSVHAQSLPTAVKNADLQVGAGYARTNPDYSPHQFNGFNIYGDFDLYKYFGVEAEFNHNAGSTPSISENTFGFGGRVRYPYKNFRPYLKLLAGIGRFSAGSPTQDGTYGMYAGGGGLEYWLPHKITVRGDYEYQRWTNFPPTGLQPNITSFGVAYRIR